MKTAIVRHILVKDKDLAEQLKENPRWCRFRQNCQAIFHL
jgi:hypothetical protein